MRQTLSAQIVNPTGLHARPCGAIVAVALEYSSDLTIRCAGREVNGKSILHLMTLGAAHGTELELIAEGEDAAAMLAELDQLIVSGFAEP